MTSAQITDVEQCAQDKAGWINIYVRLDAENIVHLLPLLCTGEVPAELQSTMTKITDTAAQIILSGSRYADAPQFPEGGTQIASPRAGGMAYGAGDSGCNGLSVPQRAGYIPADMGGGTPDFRSADHAREYTVLPLDPAFPSGCE